MDWANLWLAQCEGPLGFEPDHTGATSGIELRPGDAQADHLLLIGPPVSASGEPRLSFVARRRAKLAGRYDADRGALAIDRLARPPADLTTLVYEPPAAFSDAWFAMARSRCSRVFAPDDRATHPFTLPATWSFQDDLHALRREAPAPRRPIPLVAVSSGKSLFPGHAPRLEFLRRLRRAGVPMALYGRNLPADLDGLGPVLSKATVLRAAALTLAIENDDTEFRYLSEKLWDPLICWSLPLYHGSVAADALIPAQALVRVPDLGDAGVEAVARAVDRANALHAERRGAIAQARQRALGDLRLAAWAARTLCR